jgi:phosphoglycolate phosphatase
MAVQCVYTDLDGTMLGRGGSLFRTADGEFTLLVGRALEACHRAGTEVVITSGRRRVQVMEDARLIGQSSYIFEVGTGLAVDGELSIHAQIEASGAPALLLRHYEDRLNPHLPYALDREVSHLFRGDIDAPEANRLLADSGHADLRLVDNGWISPGTHAFHLIPAASSKSNAVVSHMRARGYSPERCIGVGDSIEDLELAAVVGRMFMVGNSAAEGSARANVERTEGAMSEGFYEAVIRALAESR